GAADEARAEAAAAAAAQPLVNLQPLASALPAMRGGAPEGALQSPPPLQPTMPRLPTGERRYVLQLSGEIALTLAVVWILSIVVAFVLGQRLRGGASAGLAPGDAGSRTPGESSVMASAASDAGDYVLELESSPQDDAQTTSRLEAQAKALNDFVRAGNNPTYKPYFGVRRAASGSQQLVFGLVDNVFGVNRERFKPFADSLSKPRSSGGGGYTSARWVQVGGTR
ncbi:MAG: hypothetical protein H0X38_14120, partial [Planctomycetes bacterium]|nr:hypothetical protein [Planctomycetota bacterium]